MSAERVLLISISRRAISTMGPFGIFIRALHQVIEGIFLNRRCDFVYTSCVREGLRRLSARVFRFAA